jgi:hypothetical protein
MTRVGDLARYLGGGYTPGKKAEEKSSAFSFVKCADSAGGTGRES